MRRPLSIALLLLLPLAARANPVMVDGQSLIAFSIVAFWALVIESGIATLALLSSGILIVPSFIALIVANVAVFLFAFMPLTSRVSLWILEPGVVLADALAIKLLLSAPFLGYPGNLMGRTGKRWLLERKNMESAAWSVRRQSGLWFMPKMRRGALRRAVGLVGGGDLVHGRARRVPWGAAGQPQIYPL